MYASSCVRHPFCFSKTFQWKNVCLSKLDPAWSDFSEGDTNHFSAWALALALLFALAFPFGFGSSEPFGFLWFRIFLASAKINLSSGKCVCAETIDQLERGANIYFEFRGSWITIKAKQLEAGVNGNQICAPCPRTWALCSWPSTSLPGNCSLAAVSWLNPLPCWSSPSTLEVQWAS